MPSETLVKERPATIEALAMYSRASMSSPLSPTRTIASAGAAPRARRANERLLEDAMSDARAQLGRLMKALAQASPLSYTMDSNL